MTTESPRPEPLSTLVDADKANNTGTAKAEPITELQSKFLGAAYAVVIDVLLIAGFIVYVWFQEMPPRADIAIRIDDTEKLELYKSVWEASNEGMRDSVEALLTALYPLLGFLGALVGGIYLNKAISTKQD